MISLGHRSRDFHEEKSKKEISIFLFFSIIRPYIPAGGCKFSFTFFGLPAFFITLKLTCKIITLIMMHTILSLTFLFFFFFPFFSFFFIPPSKPTLPIGSFRSSSFLPSFLSCTCTYHICMYVLNCTLKSIAK